MTDKIKAKMAIEIEVNIEDQGDSDSNIKVLNRELEAVYKEIDSNLMSGKVIDSALIFLTKQH